MKRGTFRKKTYEEIVEIQKSKKHPPKRHKIDSKGVKVAKSTRLHKVAGITKKRTKLPSLKKLRDQCDSKLTPIIKKQSPACESCGAHAEVAHHWIEKSRSNFLRYDLRNLIPLCHSCHAKIHNRFGNSVVGGLDVAEIIIAKRGRAWKEDMDREHTTYVKVDRLFYMSNLERLSSML